MRGPAFKIALLVVVIGALMVGLLVFLALGSSAYTCEVCIAFQGRSQCRTAAGSTRDEAIRTASDNACAFLAAGMTQVVQCAATRPTRITCDPPD